MSCSSLPTKVSARTIWVDPMERLIIIDQRTLPHRYVEAILDSLDSLCLAITDMAVRGAGLIGATAGYGIWLAAKTGPDSDLVAHLHTSAERLKATRPTAVNLAVAVDRQLLRVNEALASGELAADDKAGLIRLTREIADTIAEEDAEFCRRIGEHGLDVLRALAARHPERPLRVLTHCNAGRLAFVAHGSALAPIYAAQREGIPVHVWVDETRPRNQGASLTAWELAEAGVSHALIADNVGGHLMREGLVDAVIVGADRVTREGDVANKIGTYLKALAAVDNAVPFYVALPSSTIDFQIRSGGDIPIEERDAREVRFIPGRLPDGSLSEVLICPDATPARNWAFDVTPARLITGLLCERGLCPATEQGILSLFPEYA